MTLEIPADLFLLINESAETMGIRLGTWMLLACSRMAEEGGDIHD